MNTPKMRTLSLALLAVVSGVAISQMTTSQVAAQSVDPQSLVSQQPVQVPAEAVPVSVPAPVAVPQAQPAAPAPAVPASQDVQRLQVQVDNHAQRIAQMTSQSADESAILREISRYNAQLSLLNAASKVETAQQQMEANRTKFQVEQAKTLGELSGAKAPAGAASLAPGLAGSSSSPLATQPEKIPYTLIGVSSFGERILAQLAGPAGTQTVELGAVLGDGYRVSRIASDSVVLLHKGRRHTLYLSALPQAPTDANSAAGSMNRK